MRKRRESIPLTLEIDPELHPRIEAAAAERGLSVPDLVVVILRAMFETNGETQVAADAREWSQLSVPVFARDWDSDADSVYDEAPQRM
jgi:hypothetical protein